MREQELSIESINDKMEELWTNGMCNSKRQEVEKRLSGSGIYFSEERQVLGEHRAQYTKSGYVLAKATRLLLGDDEYFKFIDMKRVWGEQSKITNRNERFNYLTSKILRSWLHDKDGDFFYEITFAHSPNVILACLKSLGENNIKHLIESLNLQVRENDEQDYLFLKENAYDATFSGYFVGFSENVCYEMEKKI